MATNLVSGSGGSFKINNSLVPKQNYIVTTSGDKVSVSTVHGIFIPAQDYSEYNLNGSVANSAQEVEDWFSANGYLEMSGNGGEPTQWGEIEGELDNQLDLNGRLVPADLGSTSMFLRGDKTWATPPNTTYPKMTQATATAGTSITASSIDAVVLTTTINNLIDSALPEPPAEGTYVLTSVDGVKSWVEQV